LSVMSAASSPKTSATTSSKPQDMKPIERNSLYVPAAFGTN
jgi:hypothetical protein